MSLSLPTRTILAVAFAVTGLLAADPVLPASGDGSLIRMTEPEFNVYWKEVQAQNMAKFPDQSWPKPPPEAIEAWKDLRFGMFIHWGPSSQVPCEISWSRGRKVRDKEVTVEAYDRLYTTFNPTKFDADAWVAAAKSAGMTYIVLTAKHHDGFCLWPSTFTDYSIANTPFKRDVVGELAAACRRGGIKLGLYYSQPDWHHPLFPTTSPGGRTRRASSDLDTYNQYVHNQVQELIQNYGPVLTIWNDLPHHCYYGRGESLIRLGRSLQPDLLFNDRTGSGGDYSTPEQKIGMFNLNRPWESCMTVSAHNHWSWAGPEDGVKPVETCLNFLISAAGGDGNMLLNVGPTAEGVIAPEQLGVLKGIGAWMERNRESIIATRGGPYRTSDWLASTRKGDVVYLHIKRWGEHGITLPPLKRAVVSATVLGGGSATATVEGGHLQIEVPTADRQPMATVVKLTLDGNAMDLVPIEVGPPPAETQAGPAGANGVENAGEVIEQQKKQGKKPGE